MTKEEIALRGLELMNMTKEEKDKEVSYMLRTMAAIMHLQLARSNTTDYIANLQSVRIDLIEWIDESYHQAIVKAESREGQRILKIRDKFHELE